MYTDSKYACFPSYAHAAIWKDSLKLLQKSLVNISKRVKDWMSMYFLKKIVVVVHYKGHNKGGSKVAQGNQLAGCQARKETLYKPLHYRCL